MIVADAFTVALIASAVAIAVAVAVIVAVALLITVGGGDVAGARR